MSITRRQHDCGCDENADCNSLGYEVNDFVAGHGVGSLFTGICVNCVSKALNHQAIERRVAKEL